jgi:hypothetical protein
VLLYSSLLGKYEENIWKSSKIIFQAQTEIGWKRGNAAFLSLEEEEEFVFDPRRRCCGLD